MEGIGVLVALAVLVIVIAALFPVALDIFYSADTGNWTINGQEDVKTVNLWYMLPFFVILSLLIAVVKGVLG